MCIFLFSFLDGLRLIIYSMSAGSIVVMIGLASFCFKYKRKAEQLYKSRSRRQNTQEVSTERANVQYSRNNDGGYDVIDEGNMIDDNIFSRSVTSHDHKDIERIRLYASVNQGRSSSSYLEDDVTKPLGDGYLNPYQPIVESDVHAYRTLGDETKRTAGMIASENSGSIISTSLQAYRKIHSYHPIIPYVDVHKHTPIAEKVSEHPEKDQSMFDVHTVGIGSTIDPGKQVLVSFK